MFRKGKFPENDEGRPMGAPSQLEWTPYLQVHRLSSYEDLFAPTHCEFLSSKPKFVRLSKKPFQTL